MTSSLWHSLKRSAARTVFYLMLDDTRRLLRYKGEAAAAITGRVSDYSCFTNAETEDGRQSSA